MSFFAAGQVSAAWSTIALLLPPGPRATGGHFCSQAPMKSMEMVDSCNIEWCLMVFNGVKNGVKNGV